MKRDTGLSKPVLVLVSAGLAFSLLLIWFGLSRHGQPPDKTATTPTATQVIVSSPKTATEAVSVTKSEPPPVIGVKRALWSQETNV